MDAEAARYLGSPDERRAALERSLTNHDNLYSKQRLGSYGLGARGWDLLPVWNPRSMPVSTEGRAALASGAIPRVPPERALLWDGRTPDSPEAWITLGERVFSSYPMRAEVFLEFALSEPSLAEAVGIETTSSGDVLGVVAFVDVDGSNRVGITCAFCHSSMHGGEVRVGAARRKLDYGKLRVAFFDAEGSPLPERERRRLSGWGPGRADVTEDDDEDPVAIPDLWGLRDQTWLTQAGTIRHDSPLALAIRQETQLIDSNHQRVRPPRELVWALTMYLYSLEPPKRASAPEPIGRALFDRHCASCHANVAYGGERLAADVVGTDASLATGRGRGTGTYRVPPLLGVGDGAPYLHDGSATSLEELLSPGRLEAGYAGGVRPGRIPGHVAGTNLSAEDRAALIAFLRTL